MKLKFKQAIHVIELGKITRVGAIEELKNKKVAKSLIDAGFAVEVKEKTPTVEKVETVEKPKRVRKQKEGDK